MTHTVLITGTSSGVGKATAKLFQTTGWKVAATMRSPDAETELTQLDRTLVTHLDVQDEASIASAITAGLARFGRIDALVNNAGYGAFGPLETFSAETTRTCPCHRATLPIVVRHASSAGMDKQYP